MKVYKENVKTPPNNFE